MIYITTNVGKIFEKCFADSAKKIPYLWIKRLNDNASSWSGGENTRFASTNECDFLLFDTNTRTLTAIELKSTVGSLTFWREDFEDKSKKQSFMIKKNQIKGLSEWDKYSNINCGLLINFRNESNDTFFIMINDFLDYTSTLNKKSINIDDVRKMNPIKLESEKLRTNYKYNIEKFLTEIKL